MNRPGIRSLFMIAPLCAATCACTTPPPPAPPPARVALPAAPPVGEPPDLAGIDAARLRVAFGTPAFVRQDGAAQLWRYDGSSCKAFFFLYSEAGSLAVRHVETLPRGQEMAADPTCLNALRVRGTAPAGPVS